MAGFSRRPKPLKAKTTLDDVVGVDLSGAANGDTLVYNSGDGEFHASHAFTGLAYTFAGSVQSDSLLVDNDAVIGDDLTVSGDVFVAGDVSVTDDLSADAATFNSLHVIGNSVFDGTVSITGTLAFAGFSVSGDGNIGGDLIVTDDVTIGDDLAVGGDLSVAGDSFLHALYTLGNVTITGNVNISGVIGATSGAFDTLAATNVYATTSVQIGNGAIYTDNGITFYDDETSIDLYNGTTLLFSLDTATIIEFAGRPYGIYGRGSLGINTLDGTLWQYTFGGWRVVGVSSDVDFLLQDYYERRELTITQELQTSEVSADHLYTRTIAGPLFETIDYRQFGILTSARIRDKNGALQPVGMGVWPLVTSTSDLTLTSAHVGTRLMLTTAPQALTTPASTDLDWPIGGWVIIGSGSAANPSTVVAGSGVSLAWFDGSGAAVIGSPRTIAGACLVTIYRRTATAFDIYGIGIS